MTLKYKTVRELKLAWLLMNKKSDGDGFTWSGNSITIGSDKLTASLTWMFEPTNKRAERVAARVRDALDHYTIGDDQIDPIALDTAARCSATLGCQLARAHFGTAGDSPLPVRAKLVAFIGPVHRPVLTVTKKPPKSAKYPHRFRVVPNTSMRSSTVNCMRTLIERVNAVVFNENGPGEIGATFGLDGDNHFKWYPFNWDHGYRTVCSYKKLGMAARGEPEDLPF